MPKAPEKLNDFNSLLKIVETLLGPDGCPWDKSQTHQSLTPYAIEEAYELAEACDNKDSESICDELGDVLLQVLLHAEISESFNFQDVVQNLSNKLIRRHPHVFSETQASSPQQVEQQWDSIKAKERKEKNTEKSHPFDLPEGMSATLKAHKIGQRSQKFGFDWQNPSQVLNKVDEELAELKEAMSEGSASHIEHELGDLSFSVIQLARHLKVDPEAALRNCNRRFVRRVENMLLQCLRRETPWSELSDSQKNEYWLEAKKASKPE